MLDWDLNNPKSAMANHLIGETSPYLQQHADNPVDWYPWGEEALTLARQQGKPILLSVGYSSCHWCHVMARESFEDSDTANAMNTHFINIKVDREERPDLDQIYQAAHHLLTQRNGGWPLTMFLAPDQTPFFGGTYFPRTARYNLPGFRELLTRVAEFYHENTADIGRQRTLLHEALEATLPCRPHTCALGDDILIAAMGELMRTFDPIWGGFGIAPKFPHPTDLDFCLRRGATGNDEDALHVALHTLRKMADGGIYDQIGGGFCRYSVDQRWEIPHFEKMLYDNGPLLCLYSDAWIISGDPRFGEIVEETAAWTMREMQAPHGGYYASLDADSEHIEGKFYVWMPQEIEECLSQDEYRVATAYFGLDSRANFEGSCWHLNVRHSIGEVAVLCRLSMEEAGRLLISAKFKLFDARERRVRPGCDEKILVGWNALMIKGMARAARIFGRPDWLASARRALAFIQREMWLDGRLQASFKDGHSHLNAYLDDYAFLLDAMLELQQSDLRLEDVQFSRELAEVLLSQFEDQEQGGFFFTSHDHEPLILRPKPGHDAATPSGNGVAAFALQRLGHVLDEPRFLLAGERALRLFYPQLQDTPAAQPSMLNALEEHLIPPRMVVMRGPDGELSSWQVALSHLYQPSTMVFAVPDSAPTMPGTLNKPLRPEVNAWVCQDVKCLQPIVELAELQKTCKHGKLV